MSCRFRYQIAFISNVEYWTKCLQLSIKKASRLNCLFGLALIAVTCLFVLVVLNYLLPVFNLIKSESQIRCTFM